MRGRRVARGVPGLADAKVTLVVALAHDRVIGVKNQLPWRIPEDLRRFKALTLGHPVIMGRKTFESIGKPLVQRTNIVVTRQGGWPAPEGVVVAPSPQAALKEATARDDHVFVIGGAELYAAMLPLATDVLVTLVHLKVPGGDARFPRLGPEWHLAELEPPRTTAPGPGLAPVRFAFARLERDPARDKCPLCSVRAGQGVPKATIEPGFGEVLAALVGGSPS